MPTPHVPIDVAGPEAAATPVSRETVGHRLRTPLHTILGYVSLLQAKTTGDALEMLNIVEDSARQLLAMVNELPEANRPARPRDEPTTMASASRPAGNPTATVAGLPARELETLRDLLQLGRLLQIDRWAYDLIERYPKHTAAAQHIIGLARSANLPALEKLLDQ